jgi:hypothetical protein
MKTSQSPAPRPSVLLTLGPARGRAIAESPVSRPNKTKQNQIKTKPLCLVLFGFIRPNWDFSRVTWNPNKKNSLPVSGVERGFSTGHLLLISGKPPSGAKVGFLEWKYV